MFKYLLVVIACAFAGCAQVAAAQTQPSTAIEYAAADGETTRLAMVLNAIDKQNALLKIALEKIGAGGIAQPAPVVQVAAPRSGWDVLSGLFDRALGATAVIAPVYAQYRTGQAQAAASIKQAEYGRDTQIATFSAFERTAAAGFNTNANIANSGFAAATAAGANLSGTITPLLTVLGSRPTTAIQITGNGTTNIAGHDLIANRNCAGGTTGNGGNGGTSGGTTGTAGTTAPSTTTGGINTPPTTTGGAGGATGAANGGTC